VRSTGAHASADAKRGRFSVGNDFIRLVLSYAEEGGLTTASFCDLRSGLEWVRGVSPALSLELSPVGTTAARPHDGVDSWRLVTTEAVNDGGRAALELRVADSVGLIEVSLGFEMRDDHPVVWTWSEIENRSGSPLDVRRHQLLHLVVDPFDRPPDLVWVSPFNWDNDLNGFRLHRESLAAGAELHLVAGPYGAMDCRCLNRGIKPAPAPVEERPSRGTYLGPLEEAELQGPYRETCGWLLLHAAEARRGLLAGWEWSGAVDATVRSSNGVELSVGHLAPLFCHRLEPGERIASPRAFMGHFEGDLDDAAVELRSLVERVFVPPRPRLEFAEGAEFPYLMADSWGLEEEIDEAYVRRMIDEAAELGVELFTLDKGWERAVGDWHANDRFPSGIRALSDHARARGMGLGLWVAFGNADPASGVALEHPDWLATWNGEPLTWSFGNHALCLGHEPARDWVAAELHRVVEKFRLVWLLHDFETIARCNDEHHTHPAGAGDYAAVRGLYEVLDGLRAAHPELAIENCWNGGRMMDFGMVRRHDTSIGDDWGRCVPNRLAAFGATRFLPPWWSSKYMGDENLPPRYVLRSYLLGGPWILMGDWPGWSDEMRAEAVAAISLYKRLRPLIARARIYHLREPDPSGVGWDAIQAHDPATDSGVVLAYRSYDNTRGPLGIAPRNLRPDLTYRLTFEDRPESFERSGSELMRDGVELPGLDDHFTTEIVYLEGAG
jgi:Melibiase